MSIEESPELRAVVERWNELPLAIRAGIVAMVGATKDEQGLSVG